MGCPQVCAGATLQCSFGAAPTVLNVLPQNRTLTSGMPAANIMDHIPLLNIPTFGLCRVRPTPWWPPPPPPPSAYDADAVHSRHRQPVDARRPADLLLGGMPALDADGALDLTWGGVIKISVPGQVQMLIP